MQEEIEELKTSTNESNLKESERFGSYNHFLDNDIDRKRSANVSFLYDDI